MAEEEGQIFPGGEIQVATAELNPDLSAIGFRYGGTVYTLMREGSIISDLVIPIDAIPTHIARDIHNRGDEVIDVKIDYVIDGTNYSATKNDVPLGGYGGGVTAVSAEKFTIGKHNISWALYARRSGDTEWISFVSGSTNYWVYTLSLDAIATTVKIVQGAVEYLWLIGTAEGFTASPVSIAPNEPAYFKFELTNPGDEPVRMNVGHLVGTVYETGFLVGGVLMDTIEKDVLVNAGATAVINTEAFTPLAAGSLTIGSFAVLRARHLI